MFAYQLNVNFKNKIAVIGGGACGVTFIYHLIR